MFLFVAALFCLSILSSRAAVDVTTFTDSACTKQAGNPLHFTLTSSTTCRPDVNDYSMILFCQKGSNHTSLIMEIWLNPVCLSLPDTYYISTDVSGAVCAKATIGSGKQSADMYAKVNCNAADTTATSPSLPPLIDQLTDIMKGAAEVRNQ
jgi:hypothetical protein